MNGSSSSSRRRGEDRRMFEQKTRTGNNSFVFGYDMILDIKNPFFSASVRALRSLNIAFEIRISYINRNIIIHTYIHTSRSVSQSVSQSVGTGRDEAASFALEKEFYCSARGCSIYLSTWAVGREARTASLVYVYVYIYREPLRGAFWYR